MENNNEFKKYATKHTGISSLTMNVIVRFTEIIFHHYY